MQDGPGSDPAPAAGGETDEEAAERQRVAAVLEQLRAGVRQRRAELATLGGAAPPDGGADLQASLLLIKQSEYVREPVPTTHRGVLGRWLVLARKAGYKVFGKWLVRPLLEQQNAYNQAAAAMLQELAENEERLAREVRELTARVESLERRALPGSKAGTEAGGA